MFASEDQPLSLYIHLPWCIQKCPYCDFNSHKSPARLPEDAYIDALIQDYQQQALERPLTSIFIGGGTPSLFSAESIARLLAAIWHEDIEITLEANPGTIDYIKFAEFHAAGINRLSLGIQSFDAKHLKTLGRIHDDKAARLAIEKAYRAGFENINIDIMHGLPGQTLEEAMADLHIAKSYHPQHLSWYQLTIEPNTIFYNTQPSLPQHDALCEIEAAGFSLLANYERYEVSAFARDKQYCQHNLNYWTFGDYIGIGAGAHGKITQPAGDIIRRQQTRVPKDYLNPKTPFTSKENIIAKREMAFEFMLNALRLQRRLTWDLFQNRTGLKLGDIEHVMQNLASRQLISWNREAFWLTHLGQQFLDDVVGAFA